MVGDTSAKTSAIGGRRVPRVGGGRLPSAVEVGSAGFPASGSSLDASCAGSPSLLFQLGGAMQAVKGVVDGLGVLALRPLVVVEA